MEFLEVLSLNFKKFPKNIIPYQFPVLYFRLNLTHRIAQPLLRDNMFGSEYGSRVFKTRRGILTGWLGEDLVAFLNHIANMNQFTKIK